MKFGFCTYIVGFAMFGSNRGACSRFDNKMKDNYCLYLEKYVLVIVIESSVVFIMVECIVFCDLLKKGLIRNMVCNSFNFNRREFICVVSFIDFKI